MKDPKIEIDFNVEYYYIEKLRRRFNLKSHLEVVKTALALLNCIGENTKNGEQIAFIEKEIMEVIKEGYNTDIKILTNFKL